MLLYCYQLIEKDYTMRQKGSAHVVAIVVLVIALVVALGWVFYQNYLLQDDAKTDTDDSTVVTNNNQTKEVCATNEKICFDVPSNWTADAATATYPAQDSEMAQGVTADRLAQVDAMTMTSSDKTVTVDVTTGLAGVGGACVDQTRKAWTLEAEQLSVATQNPDADMDTANLYAVKGVEQNDDGSYSAMVYLTASKKAIEVGERSYCDAAFAPIFNARNVDMLEWVQTSGLMTVAADETDGSASYDDAEKLLNSDAYKEAFTLLQTAHYN